jgi:hypothetical protein
MLNYLVNFRVGIIIKKRPRKSIVVPPKIYEYSIY